MRMNRISRDVKGDSFSSRIADSIPVSTTTPIVLVPRQGSILYDPATTRLNIGTGTVWDPVVSSGTITSAAGNGLVGNNANGTLNIGPGPGIIVNPDNIAINLTGGTGINVNNATATITLADTTVAPGTYGNATNVSQITVDQQGRLTAAVNVPIAFQHDSWCFIYTAAVGANFAPTVPLNIWDTQRSGTPGVMTANTNFVAPVAGVYYVSMTVPTLDLVGSNSAVLLHTPVATGTPVIMNSDLVLGTNEGRMSFFSVIVMQPLDQIRVQASNGGVTTGGTLSFGHERGGVFNIIRIA